LSFGNYQAESEVLERIKEKTEKERKGQIDRERKHGRNSILLVVKKSDLQFVHLKAGMTTAFVSKRNELDRTAKMKYRTTAPSRGSIGTRQVRRRVLACFGKPKTGKNGPSKHF